MVDFSSILADFLNHGELPFTGREEEVERILSFWQDTLKAVSLRILLIEGEAGVGKSRLVEETIPHIEKAGGVVLHLKLRPESSRSLIPLLAEALWRPTSLRSLLRKDPKNNREEVIHRLRRLCRLRRTLLIIEDIHLLQGDNLSEFSLILNALADDPLALLFPSRPISQKTRSTIEAWLTERLELTGLNHEEVQLLSTKLFGSEGSGDAVETLANTTFGNPLALRGALRGALRQETIRRDHDGAWQVDDRFNTVIERSADSITDGLAAHLTPEERRAAITLAHLGEVFAHETAEGLLGEDGDHLLQRLLFKGILVYSVTTVTPLPHPEMQRSNKPPISFTHTLVHQRFLEDVEYQPSTLLNKLIDLPPLYSIVPFEILNRESCVTRDDDVLHKIMIKGIEICMRLLERYEIELAEQLFRLIEKKVLSIDEKSESALRLKLELFDCRIHLDQNKHSPEYQQSIQEFVEITTDLHSEKLVQYRLRALGQAYISKFISDIQTLTPPNSPQFREFEKEIDELASTFPNLLCSGGYTSHLYFRILRLRRVDAEKFLNYEKTLEGYLETCRASEDVSQGFKQILFIHFLSVVTTKEEFHKRQEWIKEAEQFHLFIPFHLPWIFAQFRLLANTGKFSQALSLIQTAKHRDKTGFSVNQFLWSHCLIICKVALGQPLHQTQADFAILEQNGTADPIIRARMVLLLTVVLIMRGEREWGHDLYNTVIDTIPDQDSTLSSLVDRVLNTEESSTIEIRLEDKVVSPPITIVHYLRLLLHLQLIDSNGNDLKNLQQEHQVITNALSWLYEHSLPHVMDELLKTYGGYLKQQEIKEWEQKIRTLSSTTIHLYLPQERQDDRINLSLFGTIDFSLSNNESLFRPRGERLRRLIGAVTANVLLDRPLKRSEFLRLVTDGMEDRKRATDMVNMTISRLRSSLERSDIVLADKDVPYFNQELVTIDIQEIQQLLREAEKAAQNNELMKATPLLLNALQLWKGEVPFPTLYDEFFENLREEFETRIRSVSLAITEQLFHEEDYVGASEILELLYEYMPEDEEVGESLVIALQQLGKQVEAGRVRENLTNA